MLQLDLYFVKCNETWIKLKPKSYNPNILLPVCPTASAAQEVFLRFFSFGFHYFNCPPKFRLRVTLQIVIRIEKTESR